MLAWGSRISDFILWVMGSKQRPLNNTEPWVVQICFSERSVGNAQEVIKAGSLGEKFFQQLMSSENRNETDGRKTLQRRKGQGVVINENLVEATRNWGWRCRVSKTLSSCPATPAKQTGSIRSQEVPHLIASPNHKHLQSQEDGVRHLLLFLCSPHVPSLLCLSRNFIFCLLALPPGPLAPSTTTPVTEAKDTYFCVTILIGFCKSLGRYCDKALPFHLFPGLTMQRGRERAEPEKPILPHN